MIVGQLQWRVIACTVDPLRLAQKKAKRITPSGPSTTFRELRNEPSSVPQITVMNGQMGFGAFGRDTVLSWGIKAASAILVDKTPSKQQNEVLERGSLQGSRDKSAG